jgi:hypothetical protein
MTMSATPTTLAQLRESQLPAEARMPAIRAGFADSQGFELAQRAGKALAASSLVPQQFQGNLPNCLIALEMAQRIGASPLMVMQNLYVVQGRPSWSAKFLIATFNQCGRFSAIRYEWQGAPGKKDWGCRAWAVEKETGQKIVGAWITWEMAEKEGWSKKSGSKWLSIPEQMFMYLAAAWLVNTHAPEISMGLNTAEEIHDVFDASPGSDGSYHVTTDSLRQVEKAIEGEQFTVQTAETALRGAKNIDELKEVWARIQDSPSFKDAMPLDVEATYVELRDGFNS